MEKSADQRRRRASAEEKSLSAFSLYGKSFHKVVWLSRYTPVPPLLLVGLMLTVVLTIIVFAISEIAMVEIVAVRDKTWGAVESRGNLRLMNLSLAAAHSAQGAYILSGEERYLKTYHNEIESARAEYSRLLINLPEDPESHRTMAIETGSLFFETLFQLQRVSELKSNGKYDQEILRSYQLTALAALENLEKTSDKLDDVLSDNYIDSAKRIGILLDRKHQSTRLLVGLNLLVLLILSMMTMRYFRGREIQRMTLADQAHELERTVKEKTAELARLNAFLQNQSERERAILAHDLHDEFGALLTASQVNLAWLQGRTSLNDTEQNKKIGEIISIIDKAIDVKRNVVEALRPSLLDHLGLAPAIEWYVQHLYDRKGIEFELSLQNVNMDSELALTLYRIVQECVAIAHQEAGAQTIRISLNEDERYIHLVVWDDGKRRNFEEVSKLPVQLTGLAYRLSHYGGSLAAYAETGHTGVEMRTDIAKEAIRKTVQADGPTS